MSALTVEVEAGYDHDGPFVVGVNSGTKRVGLGASNQFAAMTNLNVEYHSIQMSLTPDQAEQIGRALIEHAEAVRERKQK